MVFAILYDVYRFAASFVQQIKRLFVGVCVRFSFVDLCYCSATHETFNIRKVTLGRDKVARDNEFWNPVGGTDRTYL